MRQGGLPPTGKWQGNATGGVKAPQPVLLPDLKTRFARTASRLDALAQDHPMAEWLRFMAQLARAQHIAATTLVPPPPIDDRALNRAVAERIPPLAAEGHSRDPVWRDALVVLLGALDQSVLSERLVTVIDGLRRAGVEELETLASGFLDSGIGADDAAKALYVASAMQVYFTRLASSLPVDQLRLLPQRGLCPCCGSSPVCGIVTATGDTPGTRYLYCSLCSTAWNHVRALCITCEGSGKLELKSIEGGADVVRAETCGDCETYSKVLYQAKDMQVDAFADDLATLGLDVLVSEAGWARHAPNPLVLVG